MNTLSRQEKRPMGGSWSNGFQSVDKRLLGTDWMNNHWTRTRLVPKDKKAMGGAWSKGFQSFAKRPMGGSWANGFASMEKRPMGGSWANGFQSMEKRPMGGVWPNGFESRSNWEFADKHGKRGELDPQIWEFGKFGKRDIEIPSNISQLKELGTNDKRDLMNSDWDMDDDDDMMDNMKKKSELGYLTQRLGKRSDLNFLHQRMGKRLIQRFGKRTGLEDDEYDEDQDILLPEEEKRMSEFYRLIKRAPDRMMKRLLDPWTWYRAKNPKRHVGRTALLGKLERPTDTETPPKINLGPFALWGRAKRPSNPYLFYDYVMRS